MPTDFFVDLTARRFVASPNSIAPLAGRGVFKGDDDAARIYFLEQTGNASSPYVYADKSAASVKLALGSLTGLPTSGAWTLDGETLQFSATAADVQAALRTSQSDSSLVVTGSMQAGFTVTWGADGAESLLVADVSQLLPTCDVAVSERRAGDGSTREQQFVRVRVQPAAFQDSFSNLTTTVTPTVTETQAGSATLNEIQTVTYSPEPVSGQQTFTMPADTRTVTAAVVAGVFTTTANHGLVVNQPIVPSSFSNVANFANGTTYYVAATPTKTTFTIKATVAGSAITNATADAGTSTITTLAEVTAPFDSNATLAEVQAALEALACVGTGNVTVSGIPGKRYAVQFSGAKSLAQLPAMTVQAGGLLGPYGKTGDFSLATFGVADLLNGAASADAVLECELTESGDVTTVGHQTVTLTADLIDGATLAPTQTAQVATYTIKTTTGDPATGSDSQLVINTFDNTAKIYADGGWRQIATW